MAKSVLFVESKPASPEQVDEYHKWHDEIHVPEMLGIDGFVAARRWQPDGADTFITLYEIDYRRRDREDQPQSGLPIRPDVANGRSRPEYPCGHAVLEPDQ